MQAFVQTGYGSPSVIVPVEIGVPHPVQGEVLIRVGAASLAAGDYFVMRGKPFPARFSVGFPRPRKDYVVGFDVAGVVEEVGPGVTAFQAGDQVYGECRGSCAEFACAQMGKIALKPRSLSFEQAAAVPTSACTALQGLRDQAMVRPGQKVLINGASGGVGPFAVQIAKALGAEVTGVCSAGAVEMVRSIGADHVIDYTREDFTLGSERYDAIMDNVASHSLSDERRALTHDGILVPSSGHAGMRWIIAAALTAPFVRQQGAPFVGTTNTADLTTLAGMLDDGTIAVVLDRVYAFAETRDAFGYLDQGHAKGKVAIAVSTVET